MVGRATSCTRTVYIDLTLTGSNVKVKVTEHLNVPIAHNAHFYVYLLRRFGVELKPDGWWP